VQKAFDELKHLFSELSFCHRHVCLGRRERKGQRGKWKRKRGEGVGEGEEGGEGGSEEERLTLGRMTITRRLDELLNLHIQSINQNKTNHNLNQTGVGPHIVSFPAAKRIIIYFPSDEKKKTPVKD
jgi:hypothetical protein